MARPLYPKSPEAEQASRLPAALPRRGARPYRMALREKRRPRPELGHTAARGRTVRDVARSC
jgi:hypothetical protein